MPPTSTVTSAAQTVVEAGNVLESTTLYEPPGALVALTFDMGKVYARGVSFGITMSELISSGGGAARG